MSLMPYCFGNGCPIKCAHYKSDIDTMKDIFFSSVPYDQIKKKCEFDTTSKKVSISRILKSEEDSKK